MKGISARMTNLFRKVNTIGLFYSFSPGNQTNYEKLQDYTFDNLKDKNVFINDLTPSNTWTQSET